MDGNELKRSVVGRASDERMTFGRTNIAIDRSELIGISTQIMPKRGSRTHLHLHPAPPVVLDLTNSIQDNTLKLYFDRCSCSTFALESNTSPYTP
jgi:hypothetical protein